MSEGGGASGSIDTPRLAVTALTLVTAIDATAGYAYDFIDARAPSPTSARPRHPATTPGGECGPAEHARIFAGTLHAAGGLACVHVAQNGVGESGAWDSTERQRQQCQLAAPLPVTAAKSCTTDGGTVITRADIAYSYETLNTTPPSLQVGGSFPSRLMPSRSQLTLGGGVTAQLTDALAFEAAYHIIPPTGNTLSQTISLGLDYRF